jgi:DNA-binding NtrC family response regulator
MSDAAGTTLVIDDESMVRLLVRRMLEPDVCAVVEAEDGEAALRLLERAQPAVDVVLTDLVMPGIDGFDVMRVLAAHRPDLPVVCMSGFAALDDVPLPAPFLPKPFSLETLRATVEPFLARSREIRRLSEDGRRRAATERAGSALLRASARASQDVAVDLVAAAQELKRLRAALPAAG